MSSPIVEKTISAYCRNRLIQLGSHEAKEILLELLSQEDIE